MTLEILGRGITKFDGTDFQTWKFEITQLLVAHGLEDIVDGTRGRPGGAAGDATVKAWIKDNAKAMSLISTAIERKQLRGLITCATARDMWTTLSGIYEHKSASSKLLLLQRFHEYRMKPEDSVIQHVASVQNLASQLKDAGQELAEVEIMAKVLGSLPHKYNTLITAWDSVPTEDQKIGVLLERLIKEENRMTIEGEATSAFSVVSVSGKNRGFSGNKEKRNNRQSENRAKSKVECFYCKKKGHIARECYKRQRDKQRDTGKVGENSAFVATVRNSQQNKMSVQPSNGEVQKLKTMNPEDIWITDSGASRHMTYRRDWLTEFKTVVGEVVSLGNGGQCEVTGSGTVIIEKLIDGEWKPAQIENVLLVPDIKRNLFSVGVCAQKAYSITFNEKNVILERQGEIQAIGLKQANDIYRLFFRVLEKCSGNEANVTSTDLRTWHERLGHINVGQLKTVLTSDAVKGVRVTDVKDFFCEACQYDKAHRLKFSATETDRSWKPGELVHTDVCGPFSETSLGGARYYLLFIDEATDYRTVYFIKHKSDVCEKVKEFERLVKNQYGHGIKTLRADNGREYVNREMQNYLKGRGIKLENILHRIRLNKMVKLNAKIER